MSNFLIMLISGNRFPKPENIFFAVFRRFFAILALGTLTVGSASKFHAERSGREIQGSHGDPFRALFCFQLRPPISGEHICLTDPHQPRLSPTPWSTFDTLMA